MYILNDNTEVRAVPTNIKTFKSKPYIRMECILQTVGDINRNKRSYDKQTLQESINEIDDRIKNKEFVGELDHPISDNPSRQATVLYRECSHVITKLGWNGSSLIGVLETVNTPNGNILKELALQGIPVGFSYRGLGDLKPMFENGVQYNKVVGPLKTITWDSVSFPSHPTAKRTKIYESASLIESSNYNIAEPIKITDAVKKELIESVNPLNITECRSGYVCTESGMCFIPNEFDRLVELRKKHLLGLFS